MATIMARPSSMAGVSRAARRSYGVAREIPLLPFLMLAVLACAAVFAPLIAPHNALDPVKPTRAQMQH